jgi:hypothetical protein
MSRKEYYVRRIGAGQFTVAKFVDGADAPSTVYTLTLAKKGYLCDCPAGIYRRRYWCRHTDMVKAFLAAGEPTPFLAQSPD